LLTLLVSVEFFLDKGLKAESVVGHRNIGEEDIILIDKFDWIELWLFSYNSQLVQMLCHIFSLEDVCLCHGLCTDS